MDSCAVPLMCVGCVAAASDQPQQGHLSCETAADIDGTSAATPAVASGSAAVAAESASLRAAELVEATALVEVGAIEAAAAGQPTEERRDEIARRAVEVGKPGTFLGLFEWLVFAALHKQRVQTLDPTTRTCARGSAAASRRSRASRCIDKVGWQLPVSECSWRRTWTYTARSRWIIGWLACRRALAVSALKTLPRGRRRR